MFTTPNSVSLFRRISALCLYALLIALCVAPVQAATLYVSPTGNDDNAGTMAAPYRTILAAMNNAASGDTVTLMDGTYSGNGNRDLDFGGKNLTVNSQNGAMKTIIDCGGTEQEHRAFHIHREESDATITGLTIKHGFQKGSSVCGGGAISVDEGSTVKVSSCAISDNHADHAGGGIYVGGDSNATLIMCVLVRNTARLGGGTGGEGIETFIQCTFTNNKAVSGGCIGIFFIGGNIEVVVFRALMMPIYTAPIFAFPRGTNLWCYFQRGSSVNAQNTTILNSCSFVSNKATDGGGASLEISEFIVSKFTGCAFTKNVALDRGGGILLQYGKASFSDSKLTGNVSAVGGGIYNQHQLSLTNCTFVTNDATPPVKPLYGNQLTGQGGGIFNTNGTLTLRFCTLYGNSAFGAKSQGGAIQNDSKATLTNCILWGNKATNAAQIGMATSGDPSVEATYCDIQGGWSGKGNIKADPLFTDTAKGDLRLKTGSPCISAGIPVTNDAANSADGTTVSGPITTDLDGKPRGNPPTIGAYEGSSGIAPTKLTVRRLRVTSRKVIGRR